MRPCFREIATNRIGVVLRLSFLQITTAVIAPVTLFAAATPALAQRPPVLRENAVTAADPKPSGSCAFDALGGYVPVAYAASGGYQPMPYDAMGGYKPIPSDPTGGYKSIPYDAMGGYKPVPYDAMGGYRPVTACAH
jgi:hypothetical protein